MCACVSLTSRAYVTGWCGPSWYATVVNLPWCDITSCCCVCVCSEERRVGLLGNKNTGLEGEIYFSFRLGSGVHIVKLLFLGESLNTSHNSAITIFL